MSLAQIQIRRGTTAQWTARTSPLAAGEFGWDTTTGVVKMGNGVDLWVDLAWCFDVGDGASDTELAAAIVAHSEASDPHGDRAYALGIVNTEASARASADNALTTAVGLRAPIASPTFTGTPAGPTASAATNSTQLATTAFVKANSVTALPVTATAVQIQTALTAGGHVVLPAGTWTLDEALLVPSDTIFEGAGYATHLVLADGANCDVVTNADWVNGNSNIVIRNMRLDGNRTGQVETVGVGPGQSSVSLVNCSHSHVDTLWCESPFLHGVDFAVRDIEGNSLNDPGCVQCTATKIYASDFGDDGITTHYSHHITISDCHSFDAAGSYSVSSNGVEIDDGSSWISVVNTTARNCVYGVMVQSHEDRVAASDVVIIGGVSEDCDRGVYLLAGAAGTGGARVTIIGRRIINCSQAAIRVGDYRDVDIIGVHALNCGAFLTGQGTSATKMTRIRLTDCVDDGGTVATSLGSGTLGTNGIVELVNHTIVNKTGVANALLIGQSNVTVRGGRVEDNTITGGGAAVLVYNSADNCRVLGLAVRNNVGSSGLEIRNVSDLVVQGCHVEGHTAGNGQIYFGSGSTNSRVLIKDCLILGGFRGIRNQSSAGSAYVAGNIFNGSSLTAHDAASSGGTWTFEKNIGIDL